MKKQFVSILASTTFFGLAALTGCSVDVTKYERYDSADQYRAGNFTYAATEITNIDIDWVVGSITLVQSDNAELSVSESGVSLDEDAKVHYWIDRGTLNIKFCKSGWKGDLEDEDKELTVEIPQGVDLDIDNVSGAIVAENVSVNELSIENVSGNVRLTALTARELAVETVSGDIDLNALTVSEAETESVSGNITLTLTASQGAEIGFESASGKLDSEKQYTKNGERYSFAGEGEAVRLEAETVSGNLYVK